MPHCFFSKSISEDRVEGNANEVERAKDLVQIEKMFPYLPRTPKKELKNLF